MNGSKPLTAVQRESLAYLRREAAAWLKKYGAESFATMPPEQIGRAIGAAQAILETLVQNVPESEA